MKIILYKDVERLGEEGDIKDVANGYARNYLIPQKMVVPYNAQNLKTLEQKRNAIEKRREEKRKEAMSLKERLESEEIIFTMPAGESGKLFGSVNNAAIMQELEKRGFSIDKKRIDVPDHSLRIVGNHTVKVKLYANEEASLNITIEKEEKEQKEEAVSKNV
ncbi:MAG: 50S ribosomal protein L9 [Spirochaetes bacterium]|nr:50S ribosomal protein L9 [Spirochaetota bacterium]